MEFILNQDRIRIEGSRGSTVLDYVRYTRHLRGTKIGCREGDCGACNVLVGSLDNGRLTYQSMTSCLMPLVNATGKHIVTIEGLNLPELSPVQQAIVNEGGTQCGFCTVGFVVSLTGYCLKHEKASNSGAIAAIDGNICRCTGYKSLERAAAKITDGLFGKDECEAMSWLVQNKFLPSYFLNIKTRLAVLEENAGEQAISNGKSVFLGGGTDLYVQWPETMADATLQPVFDQAFLKGIKRISNQITIGASTTAEDLSESPVMQSVFPSLKAYMKLVSSTPIRNMGTLAGNIVNASPIGDLTIFFLALDSTLVLNKNGNKREVKLNAFYQGYKEFDLAQGEFVEKLSFYSPGENTLFNFEKVCKRTHLDIASVNSACQITMENGLIKSAHLSAGGVAPVPKYLNEASSALAGQAISHTLLKKVNTFIQDEISPISDARGSADYKRLLLRQLFYAHFIKWFPKEIRMKDLI